MSKQYPKYLIEAVTSWATEHMLGDADRIENICTQPFPLASIYNALEEDEFAFKLLDAVDLSAVHTRMKDLHEEMKEQEQEAFEYRVKGNG